MRYFPLLIALFALTGCATMFASGNDTVRLESNPPGATVTTSNGLTLGTTPLTTSLKPADYVLRFSLPGYTDATYPLAKKVDGAAFLNLLCVLCWGIDFATGAVYGLQDDYVSVTLSRPTQSMLDQLAPLACSNYEAIQHGFESGLLSANLRAKADSIITASTGVSFMACGKTAKPS